MHKPAKAQHHVRTMFEYAKQPVIFSDSIFFGKVQVAVAFPDSGRLRPSPLKTKGLGGLGTTRMDFPFRIKGLARLGEGVLSREGWTEQAVANSVERKRLL